MRDLTETELTVLRMLAEGASNKVAAKRLSVSLRTLEKHRQRLMKALEVDSPVQLGYRAATLGILKRHPDPPHTHRPSAGFLNADAPGADQVARDPSQLREDRS